MDPKKIVADGYDVIGARYAEQAIQSRTEDREHYTSVLLDGLPAGSEVLDLGCGAGLPTTSRLSQRFAVTGVDISRRQIERARSNVPNARFIEADMTGIELPPSSFDAVVAFYSIIHVPRDEHLGLMRSIAGWLRHGGLFTAAMTLSGGPAEHACEADHAYEEDWMGAPMYWSGFDGETNKRLVEQAGLSIISSEEAADDPDDRFLWIVAEKPH
jgi:SAM-dependent methyltransferase